MQQYKNTEMSSTSSTDHEEVFLANCLTAVQTKKTKIDNYIK